MVPSGGSSSTTLLSAQVPAQVSTLATIPGVGSDLSGDPLKDWELQNRDPNIRVLDFNADLSIHQQQTYTLWHANWEVYVGRFAGAQRDGIFLYDRHAGEGRMLDFNGKLLVADYQKLQDLQGNWVVASGDFMNTSASQLLLYDPGSGAAQILCFDQHLKVKEQKAYSDWGTNMLLYIGHFGTPALSVMLYDAQAAKSTFIGFDASLAVTHQFIVKSWDQHWQILVGSFLNHTGCANLDNCGNNDDILVLNRQTGTIQQYVFTFGRQYKVYDNRMQSFERLGVATDHRLDIVDATTFDLGTVLSTGIHNEELY